MAFRDACAEPMGVTVVEGQVVVIGPESVAVSLTPDAAEESGRRLLTCAEQARAAPPGTRDDLT